MPSSFPFARDGLELPDRPRGSLSADTIRILETHISWVLLTDGYAYKIKKPVQFDFLDFSTLERRRAACFEELRLNRRTAPDLYLDVLPITGSPSAATIGGSGSDPVIEWALRMKRFPDGAGLDEVLQRGELRADHIERLARDIGEFHETAEIVAADGRFGAPESVERAALENFPPLIDWASAQDEETRSRLGRLRSWTEREFEAIREVLADRKRQGRVRDGHGDLHLANLAMIDDRATMFDCLEFNDELRKTDVAADLAFLTMDLEERGRPDYAALALNAWLETTGDYQGLAVLPFFTAYRALVRCKVEALRLAQTADDSGHDKKRSEPPPRLSACLELADRWSQPARPSLIIACGVSGSGKSFGSRRLFMHRGPRTIRVRSDVERKRLAQASGPDFDLYAPAVSERVYQRLADVAAIALKAGFSAILDATFLRRAQRDAMRSLADRLGAPFVILCFQAEEATLRQRIAERGRQGNDPSDATVDVMQRQLETLEPIVDDERPFAVIADSRETSWLTAIDAKTNADAAS